MVVEAALDDVPSSPQCWFLFRCSRICKSHFDILSPEKRIDGESSTRPECEDAPKGWMKALNLVFDSTTPLAVLIVRILSDRLDLFLSFSVQEEVPIICKVAPLSTMHYRSLESMTCLVRDGSASTCGTFL